MKGWGRMVLVGAIYEILSMTRCDYSFVKYDQAVTRYNPTSGLTAATIAWTK